MEIVDFDQPEQPRFDEEYRRLAASDDPGEAKAGRMMLELIEQLRRDVVGPTLYASWMLDELWLAYSDSHGHAVDITVTIDCRDYAPREKNGLPPFHYRLRYQVPPPYSIHHPPTVDQRTSDPALACEIIHEAIKRARAES